MLRLSIPCPVCGEHKIYHVVGTISLAYIENDEISVAEEATIATDQQGWFFCLECHSRISRDRLLYDLRAKGLLKKE